MNVNGFLSGTASQPPARETAAVHPHRAIHLPFPGLSAAGPSSSRRCNFRAAKDAAPRPFRCIHPASIACAPPLTQTRNQPTREGPSYPGHLIFDLAIFSRLHHDPAKIVSSAARSSVHLDPYAIPIVDTPTPPAPLLLSRAVRDFIPNTCAS